MNPCSADTVFSTLEAMCLAEGGDGDSVLVCPNPLELAAMFDTWQKAKATPPERPAWWTVSVHNDEATLHNNQEAIHFLKARPLWGYVYLIELPYGRLFLE